MYEAHHESVASEQSDREDPSEPESVYLEQEPSADEDQTSSEDEEAEPEQEEASVVRGLGPLRRSVWAAGTCT